MDELGEEFAPPPRPETFEETSREPGAPRAGAPRQEHRAERPPRDTAAAAPEVDELELAPVPPSATAPRRRVTFLKLFTVGLSGLAALGLSLALWAFLEDLYARTPVLGWVALVLAALMLVGLAGMALREWRAIGRLRAIEDLRRRADAAAAEDDRATALAALEDLIDLYEPRPETARGRKALASHMKEIIDGRDLVALAEREVLAPLDAKATAVIVGTARRVAAVTALSPRALVDVAFVIFAALSMVRRIAEVYGGRPGTLGFFRVLRHAVAHLAVTGGMAAGDAFVGEVIGKGIAAKLSARLGEGIVNGLMTARLGLAAMDVLRPLPFAGTRRPRVNDILGEIARIAPREGGG
jgi:putative membrane protein